MANIGLRQLALPGRDAVHHRRDQGARREVLAGAALGVLSFVEDQPQRAVLVA
jgi:hypothetical protein